MTPSAAPTDPRATALPKLCVDMDGTLVASDVMVDAAFMLLRRDPAQAWRVARALPRGRAAFKRALGEAIVPDPADLPYRQEVVDFLRQEKARGRRIVLATAGDARHARAVADHLGLFDDVLASDGTVNLKGAAKLEAIRALCGGEPFAYLGDSAADEPLFAAAAERYAVGGADAGGAAARRFETPSRVRALVRSMRPTQWVKNTLLLAPILTSHRLADAGVLGAGLLAAGCFSLAASSVYIVNDLLDLESDRRHPRKRRRPFASGAAPIAQGLAVAGASAVASVALSALLLPGAFAELLLLYLVLTTAYSLHFKRRFLQDAFVLAGLYTLRVFAGGAATGIEISQWLLAFSMFMFLSLALVKRYSELLMVQDRNGTHLSGRSYITDDLALLESVGPATGLMSVVIMCLYISSDAVSALYSHPQMLWSAAAVLLFWIVRVWFLARRRVLTDDPVLFAVRDRGSLALGVLALAFIWLGI